MKYDTSKIAGYEDMTAEEKVKALEALEIPDEVDMSKYVKKEVADKFASEASSYKKKYNEKLSDDERKKQEQDDVVEKLTTELNELRQEKAINGHITNLMALGYDKENAQKVAEATVNGDFETVYKLQSQFIDTTKKVAESEVLKKTPAPAVGGGSDEEITKEDFAKMSLAQKQKLFETDPDTFEALSKD